MSKENNITVSTSKNEDVIFSNKNEFRKFFNKNEDDSIKVSINDEIKSNSEIESFLNMNEKLFIIEYTGADDTCPIFANDAVGLSFISDDIKCWNYTQEETDFLVNSNPHHTQLFIPEQINKNAIDFILNKVKEQSISDKIKNKFKSFRNKK